MPNNNDAKLISHPPVGQCGTVTWHLVDLDPGKQNNVYVYDLLPEAFIYQDAEPAPSINGRYLTWVHTLYLQILLEQLQ